MGPWDRDEDRQPSWRAAHNIFVNTDKTTKMDGTPVSLLDRRPYGARSECLICGLPVVCDFWPPPGDDRGDWRHARQDDLARLGAQAE